MFSGLLHFSLSNSLEIIGSANIGSSNKGNNNAVIGVVVVGSVVVFQKWSQTWVG